MEAEAAKYIGAGIACLGMGGAGIGLGTIFGNYLAGALRNPSAADGQFGRLIFGFAVTEALGIFSLLIAKLTDGSTSLETVLGELEGTSSDKLRGDTHGGAVETSLLLHLLGEKVREHRELPQRTVEKDLEERNAPPLRETNILGIVRGFREKLQYFMRESYAGDPAHATPELGAQMLEVLAGHAADALQALWEERLDPAECHSPLWKLRWVFTVPAIGAAFERAIGYRSQVF